MTNFYKKNNTLFIFLVFCGLLTGFYFLNSSQTDANTGCQEHHFNGYAWSSNIGWISFSCENEFGIGGGSNYGVNIDQDKNLQGYAWSPNIGWISFNSESVSGCSGGGDCTPRIEKGLDKDKLIGWARVCSVFESGCSGALKHNDKRGGFTGWIELYDIEIDADENVSGWAWGGGGDSKESAVVGWIDVSGLTIDYTFTYTPNMEVRINNDISYCSSVYKDHPYLKIDWEYKHPDENYEQTHYQIRIYDLSNSLVYESEKITESFSKSSTIYNDNLNYGNSYRAEIKTWTENSVSSWVGNIGGYHAMPNHHYPMVDFDWDPKEIEAEKEVTFIDETEIAIGIGLKSRLWDFGSDANPMQSLEEEVEVVFAKGGKRDISLRIIDNSDYECTRIENIQVQYPFPDWKEITPFGN